MSWEPDWTRRDRTVLCLIPPSRFEDQNLLARGVAPGSIVIDWRAKFLEAVRPGQSRLSLSVDSEIRRLATIGDSGRRAFFIINTEYLIAGLQREQLDQFWLALRNNFPHSKGIIVFCVLNAKGFIPHKLFLNEWRNGGRLIDAEEIVERQNETTSIN